MHRMNKTVVITGASSGIGRACVLQMSRAGWQVFAGVRKPEDKADLLAERIPDVIPIRIDLEDRGSVVAAAEQVTSQLRGSGLDALVNVAGIGMIRPMEYVQENDLKRIFDVNVFGQIVLTQAFLPLLQKSRGRIVNITSVGVHIAIPFGGPLNASKSAFGMFSDTLRLELRPFGVRVIAIEPGAISTPAVDKTLGDVEGVIRQLPEAGRLQYAEMLRSMAQHGYEQEKNGSPPEVVSRAVLQALTASRPRIRYRVGKHASLLAALGRFIPDGLLDVLRLRALGLPTEFGILKYPDADRSSDRAA